MSSKLISLTNTQKLELCNYKKAHPAISQKALAEWAKNQFMLTKAPSQGTISAILSKRQSFAEMEPSTMQAKRQRVVSQPKLDEALCNWIFQCQNRRIMLSGELIKQKARIFADLMQLGNAAPEFSNGWLFKFQARHQLKSLKLHGEAGSADMIAITEQLPSIIAKLREYRRCDIYNMDETGLFYRMSPDRTIAAQQIEGSKKDKTRMSLALAANSDGSDRLELFFIGHAAKPRSFQKKTALQHGFYYRHNTKAWMTGVLFREWLQSVDQKMKSKFRKILLLLDNAPSHGLAGLELQNVEVLMLPPNTTSKIQPMDAGIIAAFKRHYRRFQMNHALMNEELGARDIYKVDQLTAMRWCKAAWNEISQATIANCFQHTGLFNPENDIPLVEQEDEMQVNQELLNTIQQLPIYNPMSVEALLNPVEEQLTAHQDFSDQDFVDMVAIEPMVDQQDRDDEEDCVAPLPTRKEKLQALQVISQHLDVSKPNHLRIFRGLQELQMEIRSENSKQSTLDDWLM